MSPSAEEIARALRGRRCSKGWICRCPAHDDRHPSLSVAETRDGKTLVKCWSGCRQDDVIDGAGAYGTARLARRRSGDPSHRTSARSATNSAIQ
jgi:hypothetical protein